MVDHPRFVPFGHATRQVQPFADLLQHYPEVEQRTPEWFRMRSNKLSGSKLSALLYLRTDNERQALHMQIAGGVRADPLSEDGQRNCAWGVQHEPDAIRHILDHLPGSWVFDCGFHLHPATGMQWLGSSPDGLLYCPAVAGNELAVLECKCPVKRNSQGKTMPYAAVPPYYIPQCYFHMRTMSRPCTVCVFACWSETGSRMWRVDFHLETWLAIFEYVTDFLANDMPWTQWRKRTAEIMKLLTQASKDAIPMDH